MLNLRTALLLLVLPITIPVLAVGRTGAARLDAAVPLPLIPARM